MPAITDKNILIFTDGACSGNPGPGGWGSVIRTPDGNVREMGGRHGNTTNNRMELTAALEALRAVRDSAAAVDLYTDSKYLIQGMTGWIFGWRKKGWKTAQGEPVLNRDLWEDLAKVVAARSSGGKVNWHYVPGHANIPGNDRCDAIAVEFSQGRSPSLFTGPAGAYFVDLSVPDDLEERKLARPKSRKKKGGYYLSLVGNTVERHETWALCEARVKGVSGAKFRKVSNAAEEAETLAKWGVKP